ncbi:MAG: hypothetical protein COA84_13880 [Robiginitomaculum sp.]|nr:MAG: hypothetical protein COA84_13880 [Robiginitomaculum sp.]
MRMYRVHVKDLFEKGMYRGGGKWADWDEIQSSPRHPMPRDDDELMDNISNILGVYYIEPWMVFGFSTIAQLKFWIYKKKWREKLTELGFIVSYIESDYIARGSTQAVVHKNKPYEIIKTIKCSII